MNSENHQNSDNNIKSLTIQNQTQQYKNHLHTTHNQKKMGNKQSENNNKFPFNFQHIIPETSTLLKLQKKKDDRYGGDIYVDYENKMAYRIMEAPIEQLSEHELLGSDHNMNSIRAFSFRNFLDSRVKLGRGHPNFITILNYRIQKSKSAGLCSFGQQKIILQFPYLANLANKSLTTLEDRITSYCKMQRPFPEFELRAIFDQIAQILLFLKHNKTCHGDIKPKNIIFHQVQKQRNRINLNFNEQRQNNKSQSNVYLVDSFLANIGKTSYEIVLQNPQSLSLLSPQLLNQLNNKNQRTPTKPMQKKFNKNSNRSEVVTQFGLYPKVYRAQIFAIGLCMLQATTAQNAMECYDLGNLKIKQGYFNNKGQQMRRYGYSNNFVALVLACLGIRQSNLTTHNNHNNYNSGINYRSLDPWPQNNRNMSNMNNRNNGTILGGQQNNNVNRMEYVQNNENITFEQIMNRISARTPVTRY